MTSHVALLRGINVSGKNKITMPQLRELLTTLGYDDVRTYIQSGNVVFTATDPKPSDIESLISRELGLTVPTILREQADLAKIIAANPFDENAYVAFLDKTPTPELAKALDPNVHAPDVFHLAANHIYLHLPTGAGRTKLTNAFLERKLKVTATTRNLRTVATLVNL